MVSPELPSLISSGHHRVSLSWTASPGANYYNVWRATMYPDGVGGFYSLKTILLDDAAAGTTYTDNSPTDGRHYSYYVEAVCAGGVSPASAAVAAHPLPPAPQDAPEALSGAWTKTKTGHAVTLNWSPVSGATGYVIYRTISPDMTFNWPENFLTALVETTYTDKGNTDKNAKVKGLDDTTEYYYRVTAVNAGGISASSAFRVPVPK